MEKGGKALEGKGFVIHRGIVEKDGELWRICGRLEVPQSIHITSTWKGWILWKALTQIFR